MYPASGEERGKYLKTHYVDKYKTKKEQDKADLERVRQSVAATQKTPGTPGKPATPGTQGTAQENSAAPRAALQEGHSGSKVMEDVDLASDILGTGLGHVTDMGNIIGDGLEFGDVNDKGYGNWFGAVSGGLGTVFNAYDTARSTYGTIRDARNGNKAGAIAGTFESIGGLFGTASSITDYQGYLVWKK